MKDFRTVRVVLKTHVLEKSHLAPEREIRFRSEGETAIRSDAVVAVRYGQYGQAIYARGIRLPVHAPNAVILTAEHFPMFRDAAPELLGWADRPELDFRGDFTPDADPSHWDADWTRVGGIERGYYACSRCVRSGLLPDEVGLVSADGKRDYGRLLDGEARKAAAGPLGDTLQVYCPDCYATLQRFGGAKPAERAAELHPLPEAHGAAMTSGESQEASGEARSVTCPEGHEITGALQFIYVNAKIGGFDAEHAPQYLGYSDGLWDSQSSFREGANAELSRVEATNPEALYLCAAGDEHPYRTLRF